MVVYVEGNGHAWKRRKVLSSYPTPRNPLSLHLAINESGISVPYPGSSITTLPNSLKTTILFADSGSAFYISTILAEVASTSPATCVPLIPMVATDVLTVISFGFFFAIKPDINLKELPNIFTVILSSPSDSL